MIQQYIGIDSDYIILGLAAVCLLLLILLIVAFAQISGLKKKYNQFMKGKSGKSLEDTLIHRLEQIDELKEANATNERHIESIFRKLKFCYQKYALLKYDALDEMGGKLSFILCMLDERNTGFMLNVVHSREGCYTYTKEIIEGNSVVALGKEEEEALLQALSSQE